MVDFFRKYDHLGLFEAKHARVCVILRLAIVDTPSFVSGLNAWIVVFGVEHEEYLEAVDLTSYVGTIPTWLASVPTVGGGGDTANPSPGRSPKQALPGIGLHDDPLHGQEACPEFDSFHQGVGQISSRKGLFSCRSLPKRGQNCDIPDPPQSLNACCLLLPRVIFHCSSSTSR